MRFIDKSNCKSAFEKGIDKEVVKIGNLSQKACSIAKSRRLAVLKTRQGAYRVIKECGLGAYDDFFADLSDVDSFLRNLK